MSSREVEVSVQAEGVDEATGELSGDSATGGGGGGGGGGPSAGGGSGRDGGLKSALKGGAIAALLGSFDSIIKIIDPILQLLNAFLAPVSLLLLRILQPLFRIFIDLLPVVFGIFDILDSGLAFIQERIGRLISPVTSILTEASNLRQRTANLPGNIKDRLSGLFGDLTTKIDGLPGRIRTFVERLPARIGEQITGAFPDLSRIPGVSGDGSDGGGGGGLLDRARNFGDRGGGDTNIQLGGGLGAFVDNVVTDGSVDLF